MNVIVNVDDARVRAFLAEHLGASPNSIEAIRPGEWSRVYAVRRGSEELVVRFSRYRDDFERDRAVANWGGLGLPVPPVREIGEALGLAYAVTPRVAGEFLETLCEARTRAVLPSLFSVLDAARGIDLSSETGFGGWTVAGGGSHATWREVLLEREALPSERCVGWRERLAALPASLAAFNEAQGMMRELVTVCPEDRHLIHDDLVNRNVLVSGDRVTAVLDWGSSKFGDPLYDIASLLFWSPWSPGWSDIDVLAEAARHYDAIGFLVPDLEARVRCYAVHIGIGGIAYNVWKGPERADDLARVTRRTLAFARGLPLGART